MRPSPGDAVFSYQPGMSMEVGGHTIRRTMQRHRRLTASIMDASSWVSEFRALVQVITKDFRTDVMWYVLLLRQYLTLFNCLKDMNCQHSLSVLWGTVHYYLLLFFKPILKYTHKYGKVDQSNINFYSLGVLSKIFFCQFAISSKKKRPTALALLWRYEC